VSLPLTAGLLALGPLLLRTVFGEEYAAAGPVLLVMAVVFPILPLNSLCSGVLHGMGRIRPILAASAVATAVNVTLALLLIPGMGAVGAALANGGAQLTAVVAMLMAVRRVLPDVGVHVRSLIGGLLTSAGTYAAAAAIGAALGGALGIVAGSLAGLTVYGVLARLLRVLAPEDARWVEAELGHRLGGAVGWAARRLGGRVS
jgi:O-antigen/teichoic acid export membrane protein